MNLQDARLLLGATIKTIAPDWTVDLSTWPELTATHTAQVGHAPPTLETFRSQRAELPVILWVNEGNSRDAVDELYQQLSWEPGSLVDSLAATEWVHGVAVNTVGPRDDGPTGWLTAELTVTINGRYLPVPTES